MKRKKIYIVNNIVDETIYRKEVIENMPSSWGVTLEYNQEEGYYLFYDERFLEYIEKYLKKNHTRYISPNSSDYELLSSLMSLD